MFTMRFEMFWIDRNNYQNEYVFKNLLIIINPQTNIQVMYIWCILYSKSHIHVAHTTYYTNKRLEIKVLTNSN